MSKLRDKEILEKLDWFFSVGSKEGKIRQLPEKFYFIEDLLQLEQFSGFSANEICSAVHADGRLRFSVRGSKIRLKPPELNSDPDVIVSKKLAWILRHGAEKELLKFGEGGFLFVDELLALDEFSEVSVADLLRIVASNDTRRFELRQDPRSGRLQLRATQGHSVRISGLNLTPIFADAARHYPTVVHGTYLRNWRSIARQGLSNMGRTHIHFVPHEVPSDGVICGMRDSAEVLIFIDLSAAVLDGIKFFLSKNNVILSEGDASGTISPKYFKEAFQRRPRTLLYRRGEL